MYVWLVFIGKFGQLVRENSLPFQNKGMRTARLLHVAFIYAIVPWLCLRRLKTGSIPVIPATMMKLGDKKREFRERRMDLYAELLCTDMSAMSVQRFEYIYRRIHILTAKIKSFKGGLNNDKDKE